MSSDDDQFNLPFGDSGTENSARVVASAPPRKPSARKAENQAIEAEPHPSPATAACRCEGIALRCFLSVGEVALRYSVSVPTIWRWQKLGTFPCCYQIGTGTSRWALSELEAYDLQLAQGSKR
ncbi:helix-turn-helix transcriptional regulator [Falsirhodobacter deserti]|uniref:helix-turn-helix transcriptional regulator n=1 Tax=Falsirhodobacter deserti TaxID=1365611 RepID=UPI000FE3880B|nr:hypothetical protein [Falsirhodobacter deserti]